MPLSAADWGDRQGALRANFDAARDALQRTAVHWRATPASVVARSTAGLAGVVVTLVQVISRLRRRGNLSAHPFVSLWPHDAQPTSPATLIFEVASLPAAAEGDGLVLGEFEPNGAFCLLIDPDERVWPTYNPRPPAFNAQRR